MSKSTDSLLVGLIETLVDRLAVVAGDHTPAVRALSEAVVGGALDAFSKRRIRIKGKLTEFVMTTEDVHPRTEEFRPNQGTEEAK